jgi:hypothetical protein
MQPEPEAHSMKGAPHGDLGLRSRRTNAGHQCASSRFNLSKSRLS